MADELKEIKASLDKQLKDEGADKGVGIAFGLDLYGAFGRRGWIVLRNPEAVSFSGLEPFYGEHYAFADWRRDGMSFEVGKQKA